MKKSNKEKDDNVKYILSERRRMSADEAIERKSCPPWQKMKDLTDYTYTVNFIKSHGDPKKVYMIEGKNGSRCNEKWLYDPMDKLWRKTRYRANDDKEAPPYLCSCGSGAS